uniref:Uncharacterized protein n=1 Tax=Micrurus surinamensis TaxID=129470 RepID=A0A2D4PZX5_MICSU
MDAKDEIKARLRKNKEKNEGCEQTSEHRLRIYLQIRNVIRSVLYNPAIFYGIKLEENLESFSCRGQSVRSCFKFFTFYVFNELLNNFQKKQHATCGWFPMP